MKNALLVSVVALVIPSLSAQIAIVGTPSTGHGDYGTFAVALGHKPTYGNLIVAACGNYSGDDCGASSLGWSKLVSADSGTTGGGIYYRLVQPGDDGKYNFASGNHSNVVMMEIRGADQVYPFTASNLACATKQTTTTTSYTTPSVKSQYAGQLPITFIAPEGGAMGKGIATKGWTYIASSGTGHAVFVGHANLLSSTGTEVNATYTLSQPDSYSLSSCTALINPSGSSGLSNAKISLSVSPVTFTNGTSVALTAKASPVVVTGTVAFKDVTTGIVLGNCTLAGGTCTLNTTAIPQGENAIVAAVPASSVYGPAASSLVSVKNNSTAVSVTTSQVAYVVGTPVTARVIVTPASAAGTVVLKDGSKTLGTGTLKKLLGPGAPGAMSMYAAFDFNDVILPSGTHTLTATYLGDRTYQASTSHEYVNVVSAKATSPQPASAMSLGLNAPLNGFIPAPNDMYHQRIDGLPPDPKSDAAIAEMAPHKGYMHADFCNGQYGMCGIPYYVVDSSKTTGTEFALANNGEGPYVADSDIFANWPGATCDMWIEGQWDTSGCRKPTPNNVGDSHMITIDRNKQIAYEGYLVRHVTPGLTTATNVAVWDISSSATPELRPIGVTAADAAGLPLFEGLLNYTEVASGKVTHAIRMTTDQMHCDNYSNGDCMPVFYLPLTHQAQVARHQQTAVGYGSRFRLKASYDCSRWSKFYQPVCTALKQYGVIIADGGGPLFLSGTSDNRWPDPTAGGLQQTAWTNFELVEQPTPFAPNRYPAGPAAEIKAFTASPSTVAPGGCATLSSVTSNASYSIIDNANAFLRGDSNTTKVCPKKTTSYRLYTKNQHLAKDDGHADGTINSQTVTVKVNDSASSQIH